MRAVNVVVGNCRFAGGGWLAAPRANPEDGLLDVVIIEKLGLADLLQLAPASMARADYLDKEGVFSARAREIRVETQPPGLEFTVDGEVVGDEPARFSVVPRALKVIVGPDYVPEPDGAALDRGPPLRRGGRPGRHPQGSAGGGGARRPWPRSGRCSPRGIPTSPPCATL